MADRTKDALPFTVGGGKGKPLPPELRGALEISGREERPPDMAVYHWQLMVFGRCEHDGTPIVIQSANRAALCAGCGRRYVVKEMHLGAGPDDSQMVELVVGPLAATEEHPIREVTRQ